MRFWILFSLLVSSSEAVSGEPPVRVTIEAPQPQGRATVGIGSRLRLEVPGKARPRPGVFLGQGVENGRAPGVWMFLDEGTSRVFYADRDRLELPRARFQKVIDPYSQVDGTCTGYALYHLMAQLSLSGEAGGPALAASFASETERTRFLVRAINDYYLALQHRFSILGILQGYGREFGLRCEKRLFTRSEDAFVYLARKTRQGIPVLVSFLIGPDMFPSPLGLQYLDRSRGPVDARLWLPRRIGEREAGGHTVVAVSLFEDHGRQRVLVLDSDWEEPRVWDFEEALGPRTRFPDVEFYSCE